MSLRLEMLQVARLAPSVLHDASEAIAHFIGNEFDEDGGAKDRAGHSDLYYTVFAIESLLALGQELPLPSLRSYLRSFDDLSQLDFVHLACLARCGAAVGEVFDDKTRANLVTRIVDHRSSDGGFAAQPGEESGTPYHAFMGIGALQDLAWPIDDREGLLASVAACAAGDGSYANFVGGAQGTTPTTAAAVLVAHQLGGAQDKRTPAWLSSQVHPEGGFLAVPQAPMPDLLSTATALHALAAMEVSAEPFKETGLDFVDTLWTGKAFCGNWADDVQDVEYTFYALLALGHLSL